MHKKPSSESGAFNPRIFFAFLLCSVGAWLAAMSFAATPASGTLTDISGPLTYSAGPFTVSNPTPVIMVDNGPECHAGGLPGGGAAQPCDDYALTVTLPAGYTTAHPNAAVKVTASWTDTGSGNSDYDLYVYKNPRADCTPDDCTDTDGTQTANYQSASGADPEVATIFPVIDGTQKYTVVIVPYTATGEVVNVTVQLQEGVGGGGGGGDFGGPDPTVPGNPRYQTFYPPKGTSAEASNGEFNIGFNPATGRIMTMNTGPVWRLTPPEIAAPPFRPDPLPECCEALWQDRSFVLTDTGTDPILFTDQKTGRTIVVNNLSSPEVMYGYSDDDGDTWSPVGGGPPNGADHETVGTGPLPADLVGLTTPLNQGQYVVFCSQTLIGANCAKSFDLGTTYTPPVVATGPGASNSQGCGGLHGHVRIAPDGTAWLPDNSCGNKQGGAISLDAGILPWTEFSVSGTNDLTGQPFTTFHQSQGADPSVALDSDSTAYYCYVNNEDLDGNGEGDGIEGHVHVAVGKRVPGTTTINWIRDVDVGLSHGIKNAAHTEAIAGTSGRAACGFFGTNKPGDYQAEDFAGNWYAFIATTYDEGRTWVTVNATPNDPVQRMTGIWQKGGSEADRNLLDFNEITVDAKGRVLYGYSDGCTSQGCVDGSAPNDYTAFMRVARQSGGKTLYAAFDPNPAEPVLPKAPCLSGSRTVLESLLTWKAPDNGGADITNYLIFRGTSPGTEVQIGQTGSAITNYRDQNPPSDPHLYYRVEAVNSQGIGPLSNEIDLPIEELPPMESACDLPGRTILTDPSGDTSAALGIVQTPAPAGSDLLAFHLAQPYQADGIPRLVFTINTDPNALGTEPPGWRAYVTMRRVVGSTTTYNGVHMKFTTGTPEFQSYTPSPNNSGGVDGRFVAAGSEMPAEPGSNYNAATGVITIIVKASDLGLAVGDTINGFVSGTSQTSDPGGLGVSVTSLYDQMPDSLGFAGSYTLGVNNACAILNAVSRQTHGSAGVFDIPLPITGTVAIEPRMEPYSIVVTLPAAVTAPGSATVSPSGSGSTAIGADNTQVVVSLSSVPNAQHLVITLNGVVAGAVTYNNLTVPMDLLQGDTTTDGAVNSADIGLTKSKSGQAVAAGNFMNDVNHDGSLNSADIGYVKSKSGTALPSNPQPRRRPR